MPNMIRHTQYKFTKNNTIRERSAITFNTPSEWAEKNLLYVQMYGNFLCDERYRIERGGFESYLLILTISGEWIIETSHGTQKCSRETIAIIDCREAHAYYAAGVWEFLWIHFYGEHSDEIIRSLINYQGNIVYMPSTSLTHRFFNLIVFQGVGNTYVDEMRISSYLHLFLAEMMSSKKEGAVDQKRRMINETIGYIESNYRNKITIDEIAKFARVSKSGFCHEFRTATGVAPYEFILNLRINKAKELLMTTNASVSEIGETVGFGSDANFVKTFRTKTGMTPRAFRDQSDTPATENDHNV